VKSPIIIGYFIAALIGLFIRYGTSLMLFLLNRWEMSDINTIILYGLLFIIAKFGMGKKPQPRTFSYDDDSFMETEGEAEKPSLRSQLFKAFWTAFALFSVLWITPALILYWMYPSPYPDEMIQLLIWIFGSITAIVYFLSDRKQYASKTDKILFFIGGFGGMLTVVYGTF